MTASVGRPVSNPASGIVADDVVAMRRSHRRPATWLAKPVSAYLTYLKEHPANLANGPWFLAAPPQVEVRIACDLWFGSCSLGVYPLPPGNESCSRRPAS